MAFHFADAASTFEDLGLGTICFGMADDVSTCWCRAVQIIVELTLFRHS